MSVDLGERVDIQFVLWGYALTGDMCETSALVAEGHPELVRGMGAWDRAAADLKTQLVGHGDEPYRHPKPWAALPWMTEHIIRHDLEWPGL